MSEARMIYVPKDIWDTFNDPWEVFTERSAYLWLLCWSPLKDQDSRLAAKWRWSTRKVRDFLRKMHACGLIERHDGTIRAVQVGDAVRHPEYIEGQSWRSLRERVFVRDGFRCTYCGSSDDLHCDHVTPRARGGLDIESNLTTACRTCNLSKGAKLLEEWQP